jgi:RNA polymerase sigma-70 factor (ECF subfamily)
MATETLRAFADDRDTTPSDEEVVRRVLSGEVAWFEVLMRRHNARVYRTVRAIVREETETEDVMQQAYLSAYTHLEQFEGNARFSTWLTRIAVNEALHHLRRNRRLEAVQLQPAGEEMGPRQPIAFQPERSAEAREVAGLVEASLDGMPEIYRTVFVLREVEGMSTADVATALSVSEDVVKTRLRRAKVALQEALFARIGEARSQIFPFFAPRCDRIVESVMSRLREADGLQ